MGATMGAALRAAGHDVVAVSAVSEASRDRAATMLPGVEVCEVPDVVRRAELLLITVPDDEIASVVDGLAQLGSWDEPRIAVHLAGALGLDALQPVVERGGVALALHPAMTFTGTAKDLDRLAGCLFAVTATAETVLLGEALVLDIGGEPVHVAEEDRVRYHAALAHGSNHLVTLVSQSMQVLRDCGFDDPSRVLRLLLEASLDNALERGDRALTGPVARGDVSTVAAHLNALRDETPDVAAAYRAMARATAERAIARKALTPELVEPLLDVLGNP
ncbi:hypothetical protein VV02_22900 [Luteipulveratus mongoliensis]|uniref:NADH-ubiquinone oxidoreductase n=1 Tax=Luteipulveratus mongoliensis TaxID=571913 RepID=A0A0K1JR85_9MICO|nr:hypothetical protein VV02_22900 [Luteipulveratus mongoliensis]